MQTTEIGEFSLTINDEKFKFVASFRNMSKIANSKRILTFYEMIHSSIVPEWIRINLARDILIACCNREVIEGYLIQCRNKKPHLSNKKISANDQVQVAAALMRHGIAGVNKPDYEKSKETKGKPPEDFNINKIVADAMIHFNLSEREAQNLTMSKFCYLLAAKFPPSDDIKKQSTPTMDAHREAMKEFYEGQK